MADFRDPSALKGQTDGELYYIINKGKGEMEGEGPRVKPEDTWNLVNYLRSLSHGGAAPVNLLAGLNRQGRLIRGVLSSQSAALLRKLTFKMQTSVTPIFLLYLPLLVSSSGSGGVRASSNLIL